MNLSGYLKESKKPIVSLVLVLPLVMFYNVGLILTNWEALNGADFITLSIIHLLGREGFLWFQAALALLFLGTLLYLKRLQDFSIRLLFPVLGESLVYALSMGTLILFVLERSDLLAVSSPSSISALQILTISAGAGSHEEFVFRLLLIPASTAALVRFTQMNVSAAGVFSVALSSIVFAVAHYIGPESFSLFTFTFRTLAGLIFATIFLFRGFAVAVYTHCLYDVYVLAFSSG